jgi:hypothetical protein
MVRTASLFGQLLRVFPRSEFQRAVLDHKAERYSKGFSSWDQFVAMLFCHLAQAHSLREICGGLQCCLGKLTHLGLRDAPKRSTLAYANEHRPWQLYQTILEQVVGKCHAVTRGKTKFRFRNKLYSLDSTLIELSLQVFDWARYRFTKGAAKLHLVLDHEGYLPVFADLTAGHVHDVNIARTLHFPPGSILIVDRGYYSYQLFGSWTQQDIFFVTRMKRPTQYCIRERRQPPRGVICDQIIELTSSDGRKLCPYPLRRIKFRDPETKKLLVFLTNNLHLGATTITRIYKDRWQIEIFFKELKNTLKIKSFVGTSVNALMTQIWTALIALVLLKYLQLRSHLAWALSNLVAFLRWNLFTYRDLWDWLDHPFQTPPWNPQAQQLRMALPGLGQQMEGPGP